MRALAFHPEALLEQQHSYDWYWERSESAADGFADEIKSALLRIRTNSSLYAPYHHLTRRAILRNYPYSIIFREINDAIQIIAVAHAKRRPDYWVKRIQ
jgi:toxin ParE1/3/4